jgi:hypothetical protein
VTEPDFKGDRDGFDADERELCPDGTCTGLIGVDGRCKQCGRGRDGSAGARSAGVWCDPDDDAADAHPHADAAAAGGAFDDDDRQLCADGACTGLIGSDGKCKVCGTRAAS